MRAFVVLLTLLSVCVLPAHSRSIWENGGNLYKLPLDTGDLVRIRFSEKTMLKYKREQRQNLYEASKGRRGQGEVFSFFPDAEISQNDTVRGQSQIQIQQENRFVLPARVSAVSNRVVFIEGDHSVIMNGEAYRMSFTGQFGLNFLSSDYTVLSTDVYGLQFRLESVSPSVEETLSGNDLIFATNYNDIRTNIVVDPTNMQTNTVVETNFSSFRLEFKGIRDEKKKEILVRYLNALVDALFR